MARFTKIVEGESAFTCDSNHFTIGKSAEGYQFQFSPTGEEGSWTNAFDAVPADECAAVIAAPRGTFFRLSGNESNVVISW